MSRKALYWFRKEEYIHCLLCPKNCAIGLGKAGACRVRVNREGELGLLNYGLVSSLAIDPIEKKPLYHFFPGKKLLSLGTYGCNFRCGFCQNWQISQGNPDTFYLSPEELLRKAKAFRVSDQDIVGVAFTYNEPLVWYEYVLDSSRLLKTEGFQVILVSNGYISSEPLAKLMPYVDAFNIDLKSFSQEYYVKMLKGTMEPVLSNIEQITRAKKHLEISTLIVPGANDTIEEMEQLAGWLGNLSAAIPLHIARYFPEYQLDLPATSIDTLEKLTQRAQDYLNYVYLGNVWETDSNTYCPSCKSKVVERRGYRVKVLQQQECSICHKELDFVM